MLAGIPLFEAALGPVLALPGSQTIALADAFAALGVASWAVGALAAAARRLLE